jgi:hypothetical protein
MMKKPLVEAAFLCLSFDEKNPATTPDKRLAVVIASKTDIFKLFVAEAVQRPTRLPRTPGLSRPTAY